jgi:hypothetical protein
MRAFDELIEDQQRKVDDSIRYARELYASGIGIRGVARRMGISYERARLYTVGDTPIDPDALPDLRQADLAVAAPQTFRTVLGVLHVPSGHASAIERVLAAVTDAYDVDLPALRGPGRRAYICEARFAAWYYLRQLGLTLTQIGALFGHRDHSTVIHGIKRHAARMNREKR